MSVLDYNTAIKQNKKMLYAWIYGAISKTYYVAKKKKKRKSYRLELHRVVSARYYFCKRWESVCAQISLYVDKKCLWKQMIFMASGEITVVLMDREGTYFIAYVNIT